MSGVSLKTLYSLIQEGKNQQAIELMGKINQDSVPYSPLIKVAYLYARLNRQQELINTLRNASKKATTETTQKELQHHIKTIAEASPSLTTPLLKLSSELFGQEPVTGIKKSPPTLKSGRHSQ